MKLRILIPSSVWPETHEAAAVHADLALPALAWLLGRSAIERPDQLPLTLPQLFGSAASRAQLLLADLAPEVPSGYWLCADPVSLRLDHNKVTVLDSHHFVITAHESAALIAALNRQFADDGLYFFAPTPALWFVHVAATPAVTFTPLKQVIGRNMADHLPTGCAAAYWHGLLNEIQMLLYTHPVNDDRAARGEPLVNGIWLGEGGLLPLPTRPQCAVPVVTDAALGSALGRLAGVAVQALPPHVATLAQDALVILDALEVSAQDGDPYRWREIWLTLEKNWFAPLLARYRAGEIAELEFIFPDLNLIVRLPKGRGWQFWRRARQPWMLMP